jgi:hypothetical protein
MSAAAATKAAVTTARYVPGSATAAVTRQGQLWATVAVSSGWTVSAALHRAGWFERGEWTRAADGSWSIEVCSR